MAIDTVFLSMCAASFSNIIINPMLGAQEREDLSLQ
jgi:hypothetical protein